MSVALEILKWSGIVLLLLVIGFFAVAFVVGIVKFVRESVQEARGTGDGTLQVVAEKLKPWQVGLITSWYLLNLAAAGQIAFMVLEPFPVDARLRLLQSSATALFVVRCYCCGSVGATVHGMLSLSKSFEEREGKWLQRRYFMQPILGGALGAFSFFFLKAGMLTMQAGTEAGAAASAAEGAEMSSYAVYGVAFLAGFASRELTYKLIQVARTVFAKPPEPGEAANGETANGAGSDQSNGGDDA